jgi:uncharacterized protein (DUF1330 family)
MSSTETDTTREAYMRQVMGDEEYQRNREHYPYSLPTEAVRFPSVSVLRVSVAQSGSHFFDAASMRFFRSRIGTELYGGRFFVTSEQFEDSQGNRAKRLYTVRYVYAFEGRYCVEELCEFQQYETGQAARAQAQQAAAILFND